METSPQSPEQPKNAPRRSFSKPFNPIGAIIEYLHIVAAVMMVVLLITVPIVLVKQKPSYSTEGLLNINPYLPKVLYGAEDSNFIRSFEDWMRTQIKVITSFPIMESAIKNYEAQGFKWRLPGESMQSSVGRLASRIKVVQIRDTQLITISMVSGSSSGLAEMINSVIKAYVDSIDAHNRNQDTYKLDLLKKERLKVQNELDEGYRQLEQISQKYGTAITEEKNLYIYFETLADMKKMYNKIVTERITAESRLKALKAKNGAIQKMPVEGLVADRIDSGQGIAQLINQMTARLQEAKEQMVGLTEDNPRHQVLKRRQQELEGQIERLRTGLIKKQEQTIRGKLSDDNSLVIENTKADLITARESEKMLLKELSRAQKEILEYNTAVLRAQTKRQEIQRLMETLNRINARYDQIQMEFASPGRVTVTSWALKPECPNPNSAKKLVMVCFVVSLLAGVGVALGREMTDNRIKRPSDAEKMLGFPLTGFLLRAEEEHIPLDDLYFLHNRHPRSFMVQQLAEMVVKFDRERLDNGSKVFAFTGLGDGCGVTMLAMNLLAMSSVPRERRIYIDLNTRNPANSRDPLKSALVAHFPSVQKHTAPELQEDALLLTDIFEEPDEFPFLFYQSAQEKPEQLVHSREDLKVLLDELRDSFDIIVLDLPPLLLSADAQAIVTLADVTVLVALARQSIWGQLIRSVTMLDDLGTNVISVVLNRVGFVRGGYLRKNIQAYYTLGREKKRSVFGSDSLLTIFRFYQNEMQKKVRHVSTKAQQLFRRN